MSDVSLQGSFTSAGPAASLRLDHGGFNVSLWGTFVATVFVERSFDQGTTWLALTALGSPLPLSTPASEVFEEPEKNVLYRLNCTSFGSGAANWRISQ